MGNVVFRQEEPYQATCRRTRAFAGLLTARANSGAVAFELKKIVQTLIELEGCRPLANLLLGQLALHRKRIDPGIWSKAKVHQLFVNFTKTNLDVVVQHKSISDSYAKVPSWLGKIWRNVLSEGIYTDIDLDARTELVIRYLRMPRPQCLGIGKDVYSTPEWSWEKGETSTVHGDIRIVFDDSITGLPVKRFDKDGYYFKIHPMYSRGLSMVTRHINPHFMSTF